jgi:hypothetical protein
MLYEDILKSWREDEKNSNRKEPNRTENKEEVIKDRMRTAVCVGFVESKRQILKGRNAQVSLLLEFIACGPQTSELPFFN